VENLNLLQQGKGEIAFSLGDSVQFAWQGNTEAGFPGKLDKLRAIAAIYPNYIQIVATQDSGVKTLADLKGKSLSVGAPASGTDLNARAIFEAAGMSYSDLGKVEYLPFGDSVELMKNRQLDATLQSAGLGVASLRDLSTSLPINIVAVSADDVAKIGTPYVATIIPKGTYEGQAEDVPTAAVGNILVTREGVSDETAYQMTKLLFEHLDQLVAAHSAAKGIDPAKAVEGLPIPLHPGAERYYKEKGLIK
jgi:TRAP transporter TAXI family solute receptor